MHQFLYGDTSYTPTQDVLNRSAQITNIAGGGDVQDTAPAVTDTPNDATDDSYTWQEIHPQITAVRTQVMMLITAQTQIMIRITPETITAQIRIIPETITAQIRTIPEAIPIRIIAIIPTEKIIRRMNKTSK